MFGSGIQFNRRELSGAFGDLGTDLPLITGLVLACGMDPNGVLIVFGLMLVFSGAFYQLPMPVQPLKAVAALAIVGGMQASVIHGAGLAIGAIMLVLTATGMLDRLRFGVPKAVIRGIQLGLGLQLGWLALSRYVPSAGLTGWALAAASGGLVLVLVGNHKCPPALPIVALGAVYALVVKPDLGNWSGSFALSLPSLTCPSPGDIATGFLLLALPQIPLSIGNSVLATHQMAGDLFPERPIRLRTLGYTYSLFNLVAPFVGGIPVCHGSGGMAGHYVFGGRSGGSVLMYGSLLLILGMAGLGWVLRAFPLPVLGVMLLVEAIVLMGFVRDLVVQRYDLAVALLVAVIALTVPYGFVVGMIVGTALAKAPPRWRRILGPGLETKTEEAVDGQAH